MGNILFLASFPFLIGFQATLNFFSLRRAKWRSVLAFISGVVLILVFKWPIIGMLLEIGGAISMFGSFMPYIVSFLRSTPFGWVLSLPVLRQIVDFVAGGRRSPV